MKNYLIGKWKCASPINLMFDSLRNKCGQLYLYHFKDDGTLDVSIDGTYEYTATYVFYANENPHPEYKDAVVIKDGEFNEVYYMTRVSETAIRMHDSDTFFTFITMIKVD